jgi:serine O-acetyltransferase
VQLCVLMRFVLFFSKHPSHFCCFRSLAFFLQSRCSEVFAMDIHPAAVIGKAVMFDHGTGVVVGETAVIGDGCSILHGVTLGGTGKRSGRDRHPKLGNGVLVGAHASILGNVKVGNDSRIGCGSVVMTNVPEDSTAVCIVYLSLSHFCVVSCFHISVLLLFLHSPLFFV